MKKLISTILCFSIIFGVCTFFSVVGASEDAMYSGGRGTEEDPYLISTSQDLTDLKWNIIKDPDVWKTKYYYKLTNDIETSVTISPLYSENRYSGYHSLVYLSDSEASAEKLGQLYLHVRTWSESQDNGTVNYYHDKIKFVGNGDSYFNCYYSEGDAATPPKYTYDRNYDSRYARSAAFTGVFDGNGHTITLTGKDKYLFGFVENGAVIKNLNFRGEDSHFIYCLDKSTVSSCSVVTDAPDYQIAYNGGTVVDYLSISENVTDLISSVSGGYRPLAPLGQYRSISNTVNLAPSSQSGADDGCYTYDECVAAGGNEAALERLDFENVWVMIDGMPTLRTACPKGDSNFDGQVNGKDANVLKQYVSLGTFDAAESEIVISDLNSDGTIDAKDANILKQMIIG